MTRYNISGSGGGSDAAVGGGGGLGSLLPHMTAATMDGAADGSSWFSVQQHHAGGPQLYYPPVVRASPARFGYALGGGQDGLRNGGGGFYPGGPLNSDGSLYSMPRLEDFLGASTPALSLDSSVFGGPSHHPHGNDQGGSYLQGIPVSGGHDVGGHSQLVDAHCAAAMAASWFAAHCGAYDVNGASAIVPRAHGHPHPLALSMSSGTGSQSSSMQIGAHTDSAVTELGRKQQVAKRAGGAEQVVSKSIGTIGQRTSQYRGVTRHRWTGRYEAHLWDNSCRMEGRKKKGRQVYLGGYDTEEKAARAYDLAALKYWGPSSDLNFPIEHYDKGEIDMMKNMTKAECVAHLRRKSSGFTRGLSIYRGVTRHHKHGQWQARISHVGRKHDLYLGTFASQREAAEAYDVAAIKFRGENAVTNFEISRYDVAKIMETNLPPFLQYEQFRRRKSNKSTLVVSEATAEMVRAGGVADTCKKIQAAELPAATVDRVRGGGQQQEYQHQDLLSSEASLLQLLSTVCVDAAGSGGGATAHTLVVSEAAAAEMMRAGSGNGGVADTWKKILAAALPAATVDRVRGGGQEQEYQHQDLLSSEASLLQLLSTVSVDAAGTGAGGSATTRMSGNSRAQSPDSGSLAYIVRQGRGVVGAQQAGPASAGILALAVDGGVSSSARPFAHLPMYVRRADQGMN